ncbi:MAG: laccase domain-containing protein, partial [Propioniciclava sp.]
MNTEQLTITSVDLGVGVRAGFSDRSGGTSAAPYASLNLGDHVGDDIDRVLTNR